MGWSKRRYTGMIGERKKNEGGEGENDSRKICEKYLDVTI
jgi:hypothetical protein